MSEEDLMKKIAEQTLAEAKLKKCKAKSKKQKLDLLKVSRVKHTDSTSNSSDMLVAAAKSSDLIVADAKSSGMIVGDARLTDLTFPPMKKQKIMSHTSEFTLEYASSNSIALAKSLSSSVTYHAKDPAKLSKMNSLSCGVEVKALASQLLLWSVEQEEKSRRELAQIAQLGDAADAAESRATDEMQKAALAKAKVVKLEEDAKAAAVRERELKEMISSLEKELHEAKEAKENAEAKWLRVGLTRRLDMVKKAKLDFKKCLFPYELDALELEEADDSDDDVVTPDDIVTPDFVFSSARLALPGPEEKSLVSSTVPFTTDRDPLAAVKPVQLLEGVRDKNNDAGLLTKKYEPIVEDAFGEDPDEIPTIKLNLEELTMNLQNYMQDNMELQEGDMSRALVALNPEAASIPTPKLKNVSRLRTEHQVEGEREVFRGRADSFIARMHLVQGDRRFSRWKGSVVDSVIGVFLTENVSDHLSSSAFMSLVARFPLQSSGLVEEPDIQVLESSGSIKCHEEFKRQLIHSLPSYIPPNYFDDLPSYKANVARFPLQSSGLVEEPDIQVLESSGSIKCHEEFKRQLIHSLPSYIPPNYFDDLPSYKANVASYYNRKSDAEINMSRNSYESFNFHASQEKIISNTRPHSVAGLQGTGYNSMVNCSPLKTVLQTEARLQNGIYNHANSSSGISTQWHEQSDDPILGRHNYLTGPAIFPRQTNSHILHGPVLSSTDIQLNLTPKSMVNYGCELGLPGDEILPCFPTTHTLITKTDGANHVKRYTRDTAEGKTPELQNEVPNVQANLSSFTLSGIRPTQVGSVQPEHSPHSNKHEPENSKNLRSELTPTAKETNKINGQQKQKILDNTFGSNANMESNSSVIPLSGTSTNVSHARKGKGEAGRKIKIDWDYLRKDAQLNGKRERSKDTMDSLDYEAMRRANVNEISDAIRERGMNNMLAERIKDFLNRLVNDHGSIDLEWLRDVPPDKAKDYLLSIRGLGLKSVECVRLLTLHQLAFPVDTNVGRIAIRLGWVPLQPLPESLQLHLLELYPILESIQNYLWPRLCNLDQQTLYELHYQMITFGKVFCTKSKPNCNACPMRGECRHFASAFASARLALPGPEEKSLVSSVVHLTTDRDPLAAVKPVQLLGVQDQNNDAGLFTKKYELIVEESSTPEQEIIELVEKDMEDAFGEDPDEIPTIKLNLEEFTMNLQNYMQDNMELQEDFMSRALVTLNTEAASIPTPKLKNVSRLRTEHQVYELPDSHPLLEGLDRREPDDPSPYLLAIWTPGETADSVQPPEKRCETHESGQLCNDDTYFSCNSTREANSQIVRGTLLIPCRTAMRGSFPLNGTYFLVNEMFADHESSLNPIDVPMSLIWNLPRRTTYFGTSVTSIFKGLPTKGIQYCFRRGYVCVRGFDHKQRAPRPLMARLHFPASKLAKAQK